MGKDKSGKKNKQPQPTPDSPALPPNSSPASTKKRTLDDAQLNDEDVGEAVDGAQTEANGEDAAAKALSKLEKGQAKKRRKEEERALVRPPVPLFCVSRA
jgi:hypothetical protein